jgi:hypothetical protein
MSDPRDVLKPVGLQPVGGKKRETETQHPNNTEHRPQPPSPLVPPSAAPASAYLSTAPPTPADNSPLNPADNLRRIQQIEEEQDNSPRNRALLTGGGALVVILAIGSYLMSKMPHPASAVSDYASFSAADQTFMCDVPTSWSQKATGAAAGDHLATAANGLTITSGSTRIEISMSTVAGLVQGQLLFGGDPAPGGLSGKGNAATVAGLQKKGITGRFVGYTEAVQKDFDSKMAATEGLKELQALEDQAAAARAANPEEGDTPAPRIKLDIEPDIRLYEFTATEPWYNLGGKVHGFRGVFAGGNNIASVLCQCPEDEWSKVKPVFRHVMESIREVPRTETKAIDDSPQGPTGVFTPPPAK